MARGNSRAQSEYPQAVPRTAGELRQQNENIQYSIDNIGVRYDREGREKNIPSLQEMSEKVVAEEAQAAKKKMDFELYRNVAENALNDLTKAEKEKVNQILDDTLTRGLWFAKSDQNQYDGYYPASYYAPETIMSSVKTSICLKYLEEQGNKAAGTVGPTFTAGDRSEKAEAENDAWIKANKMDVTELPKEYQMAILTAERDLSESYRTKNPDGVGSIAERLPGSKWQDRVPFNFGYVKPSRSTTKTFYMAGYGKKILNRPDL